MLDLLGIDSEGASRKGLKPAIQYSIFDGLMGASTLWPRIAVATSINFDPRPDAILVEVADWPVPLFELLLPADESKGWYKPQEIDWSAGGLMVGVTLPAWPPRIERFLRQQRWRAGAVRRAG